MSSQLQKQENVRLAEATAKDANIIITLLKSVGLSGETKDWGNIGFLRNSRLPSMQAIIEKIENSQSCAALIQDATGTIIGCAFFNTYNWNGETGWLISRVAINPDYQHKGFAQQLYAGIYQMAMRAEPMPFFAYVEEKPYRNLRSQIFHVKQGFDRIGINDFPEHPQKLILGIWRKEIPT